jgi:hypothetical protein
LEGRVHAQGGHEKKIRLFDLGRPDAEPLILGNYATETVDGIGKGLSCKGNVKSLVWDEGQGGVVGVSAGEDGIVRCVDGGLLFFSFRWQLTVTVHYLGQVVGFEDARTDRQL